MTTSAEGGHPEVDFDLHCIDAIQAQDELIQYQADIYGDDIVKRRQFLNFTTLPTIANSECLRVVLWHDHRQVYYRSILSL